MVLEMEPRGGVARHVAIRQTSTRSDRLTTTALHQLYFIPIKLIMNVSFCKLKLIGKGFFKVEEVYILLREKVSPFVFSVELI